MRCVGHVAQLEIWGNECRNLVEKPEKLRNLDIDGTVIGKWMLEKQEVRM
jgi:hypothetical protein